MAIRGLNVSTRLLVSFVAATVFTVVASGVAIYSFNRMTQTMDRVTSDLLPTMIAAFRLAQQSDGAVASAPAIVAATAQSQRQTAYFRVRDQINQLNLLITELKVLGRAPETSLTPVQSEKNKIEATMEQLNLAVETRISLTQRRREILDALVQHRTALAHRFTEMGARVGGSHAQTLLLQTLKEAAWNALDSLVIASQAAHRFGVTKRQDDFSASLAALEPLKSQLPPPVAASFDKVMAPIRDLGVARNNVFETKLRELDAESLISGLLAQHTHHSNRLVFMVGELIKAAQEDVQKSRDQSLEFTRNQSTFLLVLTVVCVIGSVMVALYVARSIIYRLSILEEGMVSGAQGKPVHIQVDGSDEIASMSDALKAFIAARDKAENDLREARDEAEVANLAKTRFLAAASHDLRQPLQALGLFVLALQDSDLDPRSRTIAQRIEASLGSLEALLDSLLDISRLDAGVIEPHIEAFPLSPLLEKLIHEFTAVVSTRSLTLRWVQTQAVVLSDAFLLERILRNLLSNAVRYSVNGRILLGCRRVGQDRLRIEVWDTGPGIESQNLEVIFEEFHQLDNPARDRSKGLGLGLAIVRRASSLLHHPVTVRSIMGKGSVFSIEAPLSVELPTNDSSVLQRGMHKCDLAGRTILVIDDDASIRDGMTTLLSSWGGRVLTAASYDDAVNAVRMNTVRPDAVISDYRLPAGYTGDEAVVLIRRHLGEDIPALILTGDIAPDRLRNVKALGLPLAHKPVSSEKLRAFLSDALSLEKGPTT